MTTSHTSLHVECSEFLFMEAALIDSGQMREWLKYLSPDFRYVMPMRVGNEVGGSYSDVTYLFNDDVSMMETRVDRLETEHAWVEIPASRLRHFITNIRITETRNEAASTVLQVHSNVLVFRGRVEPEEDVLVSAAREDVVRRDSSGAFLLEYRTVRLDHNTLPMRDLAILI